MKESELKLEREKGFAAGRRTALNEIRLICQNKIDKIKAVGISEDTHIAATMSGQVKAYSIILDRCYQKEIISEERIREKTGQRKVIHK